MLASNLNSIYQWHKYFNYNYPLKNNFEYNKIRY